MAIDLTTGLMAALANATSSLAGVVTPEINDAIAHKYETQFTENITDINNILEANPLVPDDVNTIVLRLISQSGQTVGGMGEIVGISMGNLAALLNIAAGKIKDDALLANVQFKQNTPGS